MNLLEGQATADRAATLGLSRRGYFDLLRRDPRILDIRMTAETGGLMRLRRWIADGMPDADRAALEFVGDLAIEAACRRVLAKLPEPAAHHVVERVLTVGVGVGSAGWCHSRPPELPTPSDDRPHLVAVSVADEGLIAHEWAHSWFTEPSPWSRGRTPHREEMMHYRRECAELVTAASESPSASDRIAEIARDVERRERRTDALAELWLGVRVDACGPNRARFEADRIVADADAAMETA